MENRISGSQGVFQGTKLDSLLPLRPGAVIEAKVLNQTGNSLRLQIGATVVTAKLAGGHGDIPKAGRFEVVSTHPTPVLKLQNPESGQTNSAVQKLARHTLPLQRPLQQVFDKITVLSEVGVSSNKSVSESSRLNQHQSPSLTTVIASIEKKLPDLNAVVSTSGLRSAIRNSGVFLERQLSTVGYENISNDFKAVLLQARASLKHLSSRPTQTRSSMGKNAGDLNTHANIVSTDTASKNLPVDSLFRALEAGISRIETMQLANQVLSNSGQNAIFLEMPLKANDQMQSIQMIIEQDEQTDSSTTAGAQSNTIHLSLAVREDAQLRAKVSSLADNISVTLWSDDEALQHQLHGRIHHLHKKLSSNLTQAPSISVRAFADRFLDPSKLFNNLLSDSA